jgi:hypothetical protein
MEKIKGWGDSFSTIPKTLNTDKLFKRDSKKCKSGPKTISYAR